MATDDRSAQPGQTPGGGWVPVPDPTTLTTEAVTRATEVFRREIQSLRETLETRLEAADRDRQLLWEGFRNLPGLYETSRNHLKEELIQRDEHTREVITQRLNDLDVAAKVAAEHIEKMPVDLAREFRKALHAEREYITGQISTVSAVMAEKFSAVDGRFEESKVAVDAAFAAAKEAVAEQNKSNAREIGKSETATKEQLASLSRVTDAGIAGLSDKISDARDRLTSIESLTRGIEQAGGEGRATRNERRMDNSQVIAIISVVLFLISVAITIIIATGRH